MKLRLKNVRISFPALASPQAFGDGEPAYGARFIINPKSAEAKLLSDAFTEVALEKWKDKGSAVLRTLKKDRRVAYVEDTYTNKEGEPYDGFKDMFYLQTRNARTRPSVFTKYNEPVTEATGIEKLIYGGCYVNAMVEVWPQDNQWGRRINCTLLGVMFHKDGEGFGGGAAASGSDDFSDLAEEVPEGLNEEDFV